MRISRPTLVAIGWSCLASAGYAQTTPPPAPPAPPAGTTELNNALERLVGDPAKDAALFDFSYGEPGSPVLPLVGVQSDQITRVESLRRFGLSLLTGMESEKTSPAIGIDLSPFWLLSRGATSLAQYRRFSSLERIFARTKLAGAVSRGSEDNAVPSSLVFSVSSRLLNSQDPMVDTTFETCVQGTPANRGPLWRLIDQVEDAGFQASDRVPVEQRAAAYDRGAEARMEELRPDIAAAYQACATRVATIMSRRSSLDVGAGFRLTGTPGEFRNFEGSGVIVWGTYATGVLGGGDQSDDRVDSGMGMQVRGVIHGRYTIAEDIFDSKGVRTGQADSALLVAGLESVPLPNRPDTLRWSLQAGWTRQDAPNAASEDRNYWRFLGLARYRIREGLWLNGTVGRVQGRGVEEDTYVSVGISIAPGAGASGIDNFYRRTR